MVNYASSSWGRQYSDKLVFPYEEDVIRCATKKKCHTKQ